jgi:hypothetical protein
LRNDDLKVIHGDSQQRISSVEVSEPLDSGYSAQDSAFKPPKSSV